MSIPDERICTKCRIVKPLDEFSKAPRGKYGVKASCKQCDADRHARLHPPRPRVYKPLREPLVGTDVKRCTKCGESKTIDEFSLARQATATANAVYRGWCKPCNSDRAMQWHRDNPGRTSENKRRFNLQNLYGISVAEYDTLVREQHGVCGICGEEEPVQGRGRGRLVVDHCHDSGAVRGLLCTRCNRAVGMFRDDPQVLRRAIAYLLRHKGRSNLQKGIDRGEG